MKECKFPYEACEHQRIHIPNGDIGCDCDGDCIKSLKVFVQDQTIKSDAGKPRPTLVPPQIIFDIESTDLKSMAIKRAGRV